MSTEHVRPPSGKYEVQIAGFSGLLAQGTFSTAVGVVAIVRVYPDAHFKLLSILVFDHV